MLGSLWRLRRRSDFLRLAAGRRKAVTSGLVLQAAPGKLEAATTSSAAARPIAVGFTVSRKVGNAVTRNRVRRRLRALADEVLPEHAEPGHDYVLIGRRSTVTRSYDALRQDLLHALRRLDLLRADAPPTGAATAADPTPGPDKE